MKNLLDTFWEIKSVSLEIDSQKAVGMRLRAFRSYLGIKTHEDFAVRHGWKRQQYSNWENGIRAIPWQEAKKLAIRYPLTLDFIYLGKTEMLPSIMSKFFSEKPELKGAIILV